jgi:hypothetical protein
LWNTNQEVVWLDVAVNERLLVNRLHSADLKKMDDVNIVMCVELESPKRGKRANEAEGITARGRTKRVHPQRHVT